MTGTKHEATVGVTKKAGNAQGLIGIKRRTKQMAWLPEPLPTCELPDGASVVMTGVACLTRPQETAENCTKTGPAQQEPSGMADTQQAAALAATLASAIQTAAEHAAPDLMKRLWSYTRTALMVQPLPCYGQEKRRGRENAIDEGLLGLMSGLTHREGGNFFIGFAVSFFINAPFSDIARPA